PEPTPPPQPTPTVTPPAPDLQDMLDSLTSEFNSFVPQAQVGGGNPGGNASGNTGPDAAAPAHGRAGDRG
ncbi:serine/threonine protein kinase, partial [Dietzia sp. DQ12-76]|nr:serine/threonine protein kinase [Dietzia sp. DQ12-76]MBB1028044.1 serine/threonine protein kinase [Dietzia sp. DQ11-38-2]